LSLYRIKLEKNGKIILCLFVLNLKSSKQTSNNTKIGVEQGSIPMDLHMPKTEWFLEGSVPLSQPKYKNHDEGTDQKRSWGRLGTNEIMTVKTYKNYKMWKPKS